MAQAGLGQPESPTAMARLGSSSGNAQVGLESMQLLFAALFAIAAFELWLVDWSLMVFRVGRMMNEPAAEAAALKLDGND